MPSGKGLKVRSVVLVLFVCLFFKQGHKAKVLTHI